MHHNKYSMGKLIFLGLMSFISVFSLNAQTIINISKEEVVDVKKNILYLQQEDKAFGIDSLISGQYDTHFKSLEKNIVNNLLPGKTWIKLTVNNQTFQNLMIDFSSIRADSIFVFGRDEQESFTTSKTEQRLNVDKKAIKQSSGSFILLDRKNTNTNYYICIYGRLSINYRIQIGTESAILTSHYQTNTFRGFFYGFITLVILFNISIFFTQKSSIYFWYVLYMVSVVFLQLNINGNLQAWFSNTPPQYSQLLDIFNFIPGILVCIFSIYLLKVKTLVPVYYKIFLGILSVKIFILVFSFFNMRFSLAFSHMTVLPINAFFLYVAILSRRKGNISATYYMLGFGLRSLSMLLVFLSRLYLHDYQLEAEYILCIGIMFEVVFLMLAISHRFRMLLSEKEEAQLFAIKSLNEKQNIINKQNQLLEQRVSERTSELQLALNREKEKEEKLMRSNRELTEFASIVSHDLRAPLRNINSFTQILLKRNQNKFDEKDFEYAQFIQSGVRQSTQLIEDLLNYSRMDKNIGEAKLLDLNDLVLDVINNNTHYLGEKNASVEINHLPHVKGHTSLLTLIWQNLILNGLKYNDSDVPSIAVGCDIINGQTTFWVRDNGIGIDSQFQEEVFRMFRRLHTINKYEGTGIGLAFCKRVVEYYNGNIYFQSEFGKGTTFFFTLPDIVMTNEPIRPFNQTNKELMVAAA